MNELIELAAFAGIMALAQFSPGPDMLLLTRTALAEGRGAGVRMALGIASGLAVHATLAVGGVSLVVRQSEGARTALAWVGAAYLGWLAWQLAREAFAPVSGPAPAVRRGHAYLRGLGCNLLNPKVVVALAAILVPFLDEPDQRPAWWRPALWAVIVDRNPTPVVKVRIYRSGYSLLVHGDQQTTLGTGAIHFIDHDRVTRQISTDHEQFTLTVPYHLLGYDPSVHPATFSIGIDTPRGRLLQAGMSLALEEARTLKQDDAGGLAAALSGLLQGIVAGGTDSERDGPTRLARIASMKTFIDKNLGDPELGIDMLLKAFGASRATIYRDFAAAGGLQHFILSRRLHRAYRILSEANPSRGAVQDAADRSGFLTLAHFSRSFRDHFGERPSDVLGQWHKHADGMQIAGGDASSESKSFPGPVEALQWAYKRFK